MEPNLATRQTFRSFAALILSYLPPPPEGSLPNDNE
jgi:hypothetical protein